MTRRVVLMPSAELDIERNALWWRRHRSPDEADRWYLAIYAAIAKLAENADSHPLAYENDKVLFTIRQLNFGVSSKKTHRVVYEVTDEDVRVFAVRHLAQDELPPSELT